MGTSELFALLTNTHQAIAAQSQKKSPATGPGILFRFLLFDRQLSQIFVQKIGHLGEQMQAGIAAINAVVLVGIDEQIKLLIGRYQRGETFGPFAL